MRTNLSALIALAISTLLCLMVTGCATAAPANPMTIREETSPYPSTDALAYALGGTQSIARVQTEYLPPAGAWIDFILNAPGQGAPSPRPVIVTERQSDAGLPTWEHAADQRLVPALEAAPELFAQSDYAQQIRRGDISSASPLPIPELSTSVAVLPLIIGLIARRRRGNRLHPTMRAGSPPRSPLQSARG